LEAHLSLSSSLLAELESKPFGPPGASFVGILSDEDFVALESDVATEVLRKTGYKRT